jgi:hypothetical protein
LATITSRHAAASATGPRIVKELRSNGTLPLAVAFRGIQHKADTGPVDPVSNLSRGSGLAILGLFKKLGKPPNEPKLKLIDVEPFMVEHVLTSNLELSLPLTH